MGEQNPNVTEEVKLVKESDKKLRKALSLQDLFFMSMGGIIGSGWLFAASGAAETAGPAVIISWIVGGIIVLLIALNYAEVSGAIPRSGAIVRYPHLSHGGYTGYILGWAYLLSAVTVPTIEAEAVVGYATTYVPSLETPSGVLSGTGIAFALALLVGFFFLNYVGIRFLGKWNTVATWWKFIIPTLTFLLLFAAFQGNNFTSYGGFAPMGISPIFLAIPTTGIVFSYLGFRQALEYGGEAKNPQRDVPRATIYSVVAAIVLYTLLQVAFIGAIHWAASGYTPGSWSSLGSGPLHTAPFYNELKASGIALLGAFGVLLLIDAWVSPSGTGWIYLGTGTRTFYGLSADGYFPKAFLRVSEKTRIPIVSLIASLIVGAIFLAPFPSWYALVGFISSATVFTYIMGGVSLQVFRRTAAQLSRPFKLAGASIIAPLGFIGATLIVYWSGYTTLFYVFTAIFIGLPIFYFLYAPGKLKISTGAAAGLGIAELVLIVIFSYFGYVWTVSSSSPSVTYFLIYFVLLAATMFGITFATQMLASQDSKRIISSSYWVLILAMFTYLVSFFGAFGPLSTPPLPFPWDNVVEIVGAIILFYMAVRSGYQTEDIQDILAEQGATPPVS